MKTTNTAELKVDKQIEMEKTLEKQYTDPRYSEEIEGIEESK